MTCFEPKRRRHLWTLNVTLVSGSIFCSGQKLVSMVFKGPSEHVAVLTARFLDWTVTHVATASSLCGAREDPEEWVGPSLALGIGTGAIRF